MAAQSNAQLYFAAVVSIFFLWPPYVAHADIIFSSCGFFYLSSWPSIAMERSLYFIPCGFYLYSSSSFPRLIPAVADWMSTKLRHMMWP